MERRFKLDWIETGRKRRLHFLLFGERFHLDVLECVEMVDLITGDAMDAALWHLGDGQARVPLGCSPRYFEVRADTGERVVYDGVFMAGRL